MELGRGVSNGNHGDGDIIRWFEEVTENAGEVQRETLGRILKENYGVEYLKKWIGEEEEEEMVKRIQEMDINALESLYTSLVPLASHGDLEPFIQRIADGDTSPLLTSQPIQNLSLRYIHTYIYIYLHLYLNLCLQTYVCIYVCRYIHVFVYDIIN